MSNREEMITIEVPVKWAKWRLTLPLGEGYAGMVDDACRAALDARKSKYERWQDDVLSVPGFWNEHVFEGQFGVGNGTARLMAAAPQLLEALIKLLEAYEKHVCQLSVDNYAKEAIKLALPPDVADEMLR